MMLTDLLNSRSSMFGANPVKKLLLFGTLLFSGFMGFGQTVTITANQNPQEGQISASDSFTVNVSPVLLGSVTVRYEVSGTSTAMEGDDFSTLSGEITIPLSIFGSSAQIQIDVIDDSIIEEGESIIIQLLEDPSYTLGTPSTATVTIQDNDEAGFTLSTNTLTTNENGPDQDFTVSLTAQPISDVVINVVSGNPSEGTAAPSQLIFTPLNWSSPQTVSVTPIDDNIVDGPQTYDITVSVDATSSDDDFDSVGDGLVSVTNNDSVISLGGNISQMEGDVGNTVFNFEVTRIGDFTNSVTVDYTVMGSGTNSADGADFVGGSFPSGQITFLAGEGTANIEVHVGGDLIVEPDETFTVTLDNPNPNTALGTTTSIGTIENDDSDVISLIGDVSQAEGNAGTTAFNFQVTRTGDLATTATVDYTVTGSGANPANGADFVGGMPSDEIIFLVGEATTTIEVEVSGDLTVEPDETFTVTLANPSSGYEIGTSTAVGTIFNDDNTYTATITATTPEARENPLISGAFTVNLSTANTTGSPIVINYGVDASSTANPGLDYTALSGTVSIANGQSSATIPVNPVDDYMAEADETVVLTLSLGTGYTLATPNVPATVTIISDDTAGVIVSAISGNTTEDGGTATFTIVLNSQPTGNVIIPLSSNDITEGTLSISGVTFTPSNWDTPQTVTVTGQDDSILDGDINFAIVAGKPLSTDPMYAALNDVDITDVTVLNEDNDGCVAQPVRDPNIPTVFCENFAQDLNAYVTVPSGYDLIWSRSDNFNNMGARLSDPVVSTAGTYYGFFDNGSCTSLPLAINLARNDRPTIESTVPATICGPGSVTLRATASASGGSIYWYASETATQRLSEGLSFTTPIIEVTTTYYVEVLANGCTSVRVPVTVTVNDPIAIGTTTNGTACNGVGENTTLDLDTTREGTGLAAGVWSIVSPTSATITIDANNVVNFLGAPDGEYVFRLTTNVAVAPCTDESVEVTITVGSCAVDSDGDGLMDQDEIALGLDPNNPDSDGDGIDDATEVGPDINNPLDSGEFGVIDALNPCFPNISVACNVDLGLEKIVDKANALEGDQIVFTVTLINQSPIMVTNIRVNELIDPNITGFQYVSHSASKGIYDVARGVWELDEVLALEENILTLTATVVREGTFQNVVALVDSFPMDADSTNNTARVSVTVGPRSNDECGFLFNQFSPNGDGTNDTLFINCIDQYPNNSIQIYDRYGNEVFVARKYDNSWTGTGKNGNLPKGTYFYILDLGDGTEVRKGWIQIIR